MGWVKTLQNLYDPIFEFPYLTESLFFSLRWCWYSLRMVDSVQHRLAKFTRSRGFWSVPRRPFHGEVPVVSTEKPWGSTVETVVTWAYNKQWGYHQWIFLVGGCWWFQNVSKLFWSRLERTSFASSSLNFRPSHHSGTPLWWCLKGIRLKDPSANRYQRGHSYAHARNHYLPSGKLT